MTRLEKSYLKWLYPQVYPGPDRDYWGLFEQMLETEFVWLIPNDDNRVCDGLDVRAEFMGDRDPLGHYEFISKPCSVLEVLIGLSRRLAFTTSETQESWAWQLIENLELHKFQDPVTTGRKETVSIILEHLVWRTYEPSGAGGFFPLSYAAIDQRKVELWYQMSEYIAESEYED